MHLSVSSSRTIGTSSWDSVFFAQKLTVVAEVAGRLGVEAAVRLQAEAAVLLQAEAVVQRPPVEVEALLLLLPLVSSVRVHQAHLSHTRGEERSDGGVGTMPLCESRVFKRLILVLSLHDTHQAVEHPPLAERQEGQRRLLQRLTALVLVALRGVRHGKEEPVPSAREEA